MQKVWMNNFAENLPTIRKADDIKKLPKSKKPAIVIGAGPSLKHVDLKQLRNWNGLVFACDRMFPELQKIGVYPDYVTTVDGNPMVADFYSDVDFNCKTRVVLACQTTHPDIAKLIPLELQHYFVGLWDNPLNPASLTRMFHLMTNKMIMSTGGNTGACSWNLAHFLGCNPIGVLGLDFGYDTLNFEKTTYFKTFKVLASINGKLDLNLFKSYYRRVTSAAGFEMLTDQMFLTYFQLFKRLLTTAKVKTYNLGRHSILPKTLVPFVEFETFLEKTP